MSENYWKTGRNTNIKIYAIPKCASGSNFSLSAIDSNSSRKSCRSGRRGAWNWEIIDFGFRDVAAATSCEHLKSKEKKVIYSEILFQSLRRPLKVTGMENSTWKVPNDVPVDAADACDCAAMRKIGLNL